MSRYRDTQFQADRKVTTYVVWIKIYANLFGKQIMTFPVPICYHWRMGASQRVPDSSFQKLNCQNINQNFNKNMGIFLFKIYQVNVWNSRLLDKNIQNILWHLFFFQGSPRKPRKPTEYQPDPIFLDSDSTPASYYVIIIIIACCC